MTNLFSKQCRSFWGELHLSQLHNVPCSVELSCPPALCKTGWTSQSLERAKLAEPAEEPSSACSHRSVSEYTPQTPAKQAKQLGGAARPRGKATDSLSLSKGPSWICYGWPVNLTGLPPLPCSKAIALKILLANIFKNITPEKPYTKLSFRIPSTTPEETRGVYLLELGYNWDVCVEIAPGHDFKGST